MYQVLILVKVDALHSEWRPMRPTGGEPYRFATLKEAESAARMMGDAYTLLGKVRIEEC